MSKIRAGAIAFGICVVFFGSLALLGEGVGPVQLVFAPLAWMGLTKVFVDGGLNPGYTDPAIEQNRERRQARRQARREARARRRER